MVGINDLLREGRIHELRKGGWWAKNSYIFKLECCMPEMSAEGASGRGGGGGMGSGDGTENLFRKWDVF